MTTEVDDRQNLTLEEVGAALTADVWGARRGDFKWVFQQDTKEYKLPPDQFLNVIAQEMMYARSRLDRNCYNRDPDLPWHYLFAEYLLRSCGYTVKKRPMPWSSDALNELDGLNPRLMSVEHCGGLILCEPGPIIFHELGHALTCRPADGRGAGWSASAETPEATGSQQAIDRAVRSEELAAAMMSFILCLIAVADSNALSDYKIATDLLPVPRRRAFVARQAASNAEPEFQWITQGVKWRRTAYAPAPKWTSVFAFCYLYAAYLDNSPLLARCLWMLGISGVSNCDMLSMGYYRDPVLKDGVRLVGANRWDWPQAQEMGRVSKRFTLQRALPPRIERAHIAGTDWRTYPQQQAGQVWERSDAADRQPFAFRSCYRYIGGPLFNFPWS